MPGSELEDASTMVETNSTANDHEPPLYPPTLHPPSLPPPPLYPPPDVTPLAQALTPPISPVHAVKRAVKEEVGWIRDPREFFRSNREFFLVLVGACIGIQNMARTPLNMAKYGAAYLFMSVVVTFIVGISCMVMELGLGQFHSTGPLHIFRHAVPALEGLGWVILLAHAVQTINLGAVGPVMLTGALLSIDTPAKRCANPDKEPGTWNTHSCFTMAHFLSCTHGTKRNPKNPAHNFYFRGRCYDVTTVHTQFPPTRCIIVHLIYLTYLRFLTELEACIGDPKKANSELCPVNFKFHFSRITPRQLFRSKFNSSAYRRLARPKGEMCPLFTERYGCKGNRRPWTPLDTWGSAKADRSSNHHAFFPQDKEISIRLGTWREKHVYDVAKCFFDLVKDANYGPLGCENGDEAFYLKNVSGTPNIDDNTFRRPKLSCVLMSYCKDTFPEEDMTDIECLRKVADIQHSFSAVEVAKYHFLALPSDGATETWRPLSLICHGVYWAVVCGLAVGGFRRLGAISHTFVLGPFVLLVALTFLSLFHDGAFAGISSYFHMDWCVFTEIDVLFDACYSSCYSLGLGFCTNVVLGSRRSFHSDFVRDAIFISFVDLGVSILCGLSTFGILGFLAESTHMPVEEVIASSPYVTVQIMQAVAEIAGAPVLLTLYFAVFTAFLMFTQAVYVLVVVTTLTDEFVWARTNFRTVAAGLSLLNCLVSLPFASNMSKIRLDEMVTYFERYFFPGMQLICYVYFMWLYGGFRVLGDLNMMLDGSAEYKRGSKHAIGTMVMRKAGMLFLVSWSFNSPILIFVYLCLYTTENQDSVSYREYVLPAMGFVMVVGVFAYRLGRGHLRCGELLHPAPAWGPALDEHRTGRYAEPGPSSTFTAYMKKLTSWTRGKSAAQPIADLFNEPAAKA